MGPWGHTHAQGESAHAPSDSLRQQNGADFHPFYIRLAMIHCHLYLSGPPQKQAVIGAVFLKASRERSLSIMSVNNLIVMLGGFIAYLLKRLNNSTESLFAAICIGVSPSYDVLYVWYVSLMLGSTPFSRRRRMKSILSSSTAFRRTLPYLLRAMLVTNSGDKELRILLNSSIPSNLSSVYIAFNNRRSFILSESSSDPPESNSAISV